MELTNVTQEIKTSAIRIDSLQLILEVRNALKEINPHGLEPSNDSFPEFRLPLVEPALSPGTQDNRALDE